MASATPDPKAAELAAAIEEIRARVRARHPGNAAGIPLPDLLPVLHARDAAEGKVAAIGGVNPRPPGLINNAIQATKRTIARSLNWFIRDQVEFNQAAVGGFSSVLDAFNETNQAIAALAARIEDKDLAASLADFREWRNGWERRLSKAEVAMLRSIAELNTAEQHRLADIEAKVLRHLDQRDTSLSDSVRLSNEQLRNEVVNEFRSALTQLRENFETVRADYERLIHQELRVIRQRAASAPAPGSTAPASRPESLPIDYTRFADRFRGSEEDIRERMRRYVPNFSGCSAVLDVGCGRGEFLGLLNEAGVSAAGIDLDAEAVAYCRSKGLHAECADLFEYLPAHGPFDGIFCSQVIEHLAPERLPEFVRLCSEALKPGGTVLFETPNPACLAIFATHFYLDPTHTRPVPSQLMVFYLEEFGFGSIGVAPVSPAAETIPAVNELPAGFRDAFFGGLDYFIVAKKL